MVVIGLAEAPCPGEVESGDRGLAEPSPDGMLLAVVDGTGHGREAAAAAGLAIATLVAFAREGLIALMVRCHQELKGTRGAVMTLAFVHRRDRTLTWLGVGNVEAVLCRAGAEGRVVERARALLRGGAVGHQLPELRESVMPIEPDDLVIMATDGIAGDFAEDLASSGEPQDLADRILARHRKGHDDALVMVVRYLGDQEL